MVALKKHYEDLEKEAQEKADANLTPQERKLRDTADKAKKEGEETVDKLSKIRKGLAGNLAAALEALPAEEIATMVRNATTKAEVILPLGKMDPKNITPVELEQFLQGVAKRGGRSDAERNVLRKTIVKTGQALAAQANKMKEAKAAKQAQLATATN